MTAVRAFSVETKAAKVARLQSEWLSGAAHHLFKLNVFDITDPQEVSQAYELAETLWEGSENADFEDAEEWLSAEDAVDEELTYWGD